ncbi:sigma-w pathway protein ysdB [Bacillus infantis]|uniref:Sigma-w pathway protein ysdB n=1 Tax=Bacillus infantis TaxID=324767 RepID=A0A5D4R4D1_9BACI|nr:sigma-w pathway protein ysdB [Bacillus infantis]TYS45430.1 sigma-w pathway protein ysdB [Bacillus infantis]
MMWAIRLLLFALILFLIYTCVKYIINPKRKLELAHEQKRYYFLDDQNNVRKNFLITYKGVLLEGEKYLGTTDNAFEVVSIFIWPHNQTSLKGMVREDFQFIERKISEQYPNAKLDWKSPIKEFMSKGTDSI